jgi:hypothetical protein
MYLICWTVFSIFPLPAKGVKEGKARIKVQALQDIVSKDCLYKVLLGGIFYKLVVKLRLLTLFLSISFWS